MKQISSHFLAKFVPTSTGTSNEVSNVLEHSIKISEHSHDAEKREKISNYSIGKVQLALRTTR